MRLELIVTMPYSSHMNEMSPSYTSLTQSFWKNPKTEPVSKPSYTHYTQYKHITHVQTTQNTLTVLITPIYTICQDDITVCTL